jgi:prolyl-tRNA synthetase
MTDHTPGAKFYAWELKGVPLRIELGPRDLKNNQVVMVDRLGLGKQIVPIDSLVTAVHERLALIQTTLFARAVEKRASQWHKVAFFADFAEQLESEGGFYQTGWCGAIACETKLKTIKATIRCVLPEKSFPTCFNCDMESRGDILAAKAY